MWEYTDLVQEHFLNPRNVGEIDNPSGVGDVGSLACGDALKLTLHVNDDDVITDAKFKTFGCASAIASSSALTEMIKGMKVDEAAKITNDDIADFLGGLPKEKMHCSVMGREALEAAIADYRGIPLPVAEGNVICECFGVTDLEISRVVTESGLKTVAEVTNFTKAGGGCGKCERDIQALIDKVSGSFLDVPMAEVKKPKRMTIIQKLKMIEEVLEREVRPALKKDGGDIELIDVDGDTVYVSLRGSCSSCNTSQITLKDHVEKKLREFVLDTLSVEEA